MFNDVQFLDIVLFQKVGRWHRLEGEDKGREKKEKILGLQKKKTLNGLNK